MSQLHNEMVEFTFRFGLIADRLTALEHQVSTDLYHAVERGVADEEVNRIITILNLTHQEIRRMQDELESCRMLNEQALKSLGYDPPSWMGLK